MMKRSAEKHREQLKISAKGILLYSTKTHFRTSTLQTLYKEMVKTPEGKTCASEIFRKAKPGYHLTTVQSVEGILK